jgi:predicted GNAT family acetyltransferase
VRVERVEDAAEFLRRTAALRASEPVLTNVIGTIAQGVVDGRRYDQAWWWVVLADDGTPVGCASRTAPWHLLLGPMPQEAAAALAPAVVDADPDLPGVVAHADVAEAFAAAVPGGRRLEVTMREVVRVLDELRQPAHVPGEVVAATHDELPLLLRWHAQFAKDAGLPSHDVEQSVAARLSVGGLLWWTVDGTHVSMAGHTAPVQVPGGAVGRIGPVYTPAQYRGRGYAAALTAAVVRRLQPLCSVVMLFADADNATSNGLYERLGFRSQGELVEALLVGA